MLRRPKLFTDFLYARSKGWIVDSRYRKLASKRAAAETGFQTASIIRKFDDIEQFKPRNLPDRFVLKPDNYDSSAGVMLLEKREKKFFDFMSERLLTLEEIKAEQKKVAERRAPVEPKYIVEEFIFAENEGVPFDYKIYQFIDEAALIVQIDRNYFPRRVALFDGRFKPLPKGMVTMNPIVKSMVLGQYHVVPKQADALLESSKRMIDFLKTPFISVDTYAGVNGPTLGELTYVPGASYYGHFQFPRSFNKKMGRMWENSMRILQQEIPLIEGFPPAQEKPTLEQIIENRILRMKKETVSLKPRWPAPQIE